jgi:hypothetical protein
VQHLVDAWSWLDGTLHREHLTDEAFHFVAYTEDRLDPRLELYVGDRKITALPIRDPHTPHHWWKAAWMLVLHACANHYALATPLPQEVSRRLLASK